MTETEFIDEWAKNLKWPPLAPDCPKHPGTRMVRADGTQPYHDVKEPHWRCELWIGSGVCGATLPLVPQPLGAGRGGD